MQGHSLITATDADLLARFAGARDEAAFAALVRRHAGLVFAAAMRRVGGRQDAEDVAQAVFVVLARKASRVDARGSLGPWLLRTTRLVAANALKRRRRREHHERLAARERAMNQPSTAAGGDPAEVLAWREIAPILDDCVLRLCQRDRLAVVMRHFERRPIRDVAAALDVSDDAAKQRVSRATRRLRDLLDRRGVSLPAATLATLLANHATATAPVHFAAACVTSALSPAAAGAGTAALLAKGAMTAMTTSNLIKLSAAAALVAGLAGTVAVTAGQDGDPPAPSDAAPAFAFRVAGDPTPADRAGRREQVRLWLDAVAAFADANNQLPADLADAEPYLKGEADAGRVVYAAPPSYLEFLNSRVPVVLEADPPPEGEHVGFAGRGGMEVLYVVVDERRQQLRKLAGLGEAGRAYREELREREALGDRVQDAQHIAQAGVEYARQNGEWPADIADARPPADGGEFPADAFDYHRPPTAAPPPEWPVLILSEPLAGGIAVGMADGSAAVLEPAVAERLLAEAKQRAAAPADDEPTEVPDARESRRTTATLMLETVRRYLAANATYPPELADVRPYWEGDEVAFEPERYLYAAPQPAVYVDAGSEVRVTIRNFFGNGQDLLDVFRVDAGGLVNLPDLGPIRVGGLTERAAGEAVYQAAVEEKIFAPNLVAPVRVLVVSDPAGPTDDRGVDLSPPVLMEKQGDGTGRFVAFDSGSVHYVVNEERIEELAGRLSTPPATRPAGE